MHCSARRSPAVFGDECGGGSDTEGKIRARITA